MSNIQPTTLSNDMLEQGQSVAVDLLISVASGVPTITPVGNKTASAVLLGTSAAAPLDQTTIDSFLGITGDIVAATAFSSTALGTDAMGFVINMKGQAKSAIALEYSLYAATVVVDGKLATASALTSALTSAVTVSAGGNIYGRVVASGFDAATCLMRVTVHYYSN